MAGQTRAAKPKALSAEFDPEKATFIVLKTTPVTGDDARSTIPVFSIDDKTYSVPAKVRMNQSLRVMHIQRTQGQEAAMDYMMGMMLGDEGYEALMAYDDLTDAVMSDILEIVVSLVYGQVEVPKS